MAFRQSLTELSEQASARLYGIAFTLITLAGAALRIIQYPYIPPGVNVDEASSAYEAYSLALTGKDRWGNAWPAYFPSWGSGQNVLQAYLSIPFVKYMGLTLFSARMVALICGILTIPLIGIALRPLGRYAAALGMLVIAVIPWHLMLSRWALESNLIPFFMLLGCTLTARALATGRRRWIWPSLLPFALALYAYGTTIVVLPLMAIVLACLYGRRIRQRWGAWLIALGGFALLATPFGIFFLENYILHRNLPWTDGLPFSTLMLPGSRLDQISGDGTGWERFMTNLRFFINGFNDGTPYNMLPGYPPLMLIILPLALIGIAAATIMLLQRRRATTGGQVTMGIFWAWALAALPMLGMFALNINRFNHFYLPAIVLAAWAVDRIIVHLRTPVSKNLLRGLFVLCILAENSLSTGYYFTGYEHSGIRTAFNADLPEAFEAADRLPVRQLYITGRLPIPYMYAAFLAKYPPARFQREARYEAKGGTYYMRRFGKYVFNREELDTAQAFGYLLAKDEFWGEGARRHVAFSNERWEVATVDAADSLQSNTAPARP